ncbi:hypothetical protein AB4Y36_31475 [Paraburkholderia sp. BR10936]|uniref:hypothetical protein n=1 Tax=Paraburkholderia sp. BR10936 TaxID=3236993 RepID=UPI0034D17469
MFGQAENDFGFLIHTTSEHVVRGGVGILALGSRLPLAFADAMWIPLISLVDCGGKLVFLVFACAPPHENGTRATSL